MKQVNPIADGIFEAAHQVGFRRSGSNCYVEGEETVLVINLQRSQWGNQYYINLVVIIKAVRAELVWKPPPRQSTFDVCWRLEMLFPDYPEDTEQMDEYLDLDNVSFSDEERRSWVSEKVTVYGIPFLRRFSTAAAIREGYRSGIDLFIQKTDRLRAFLDG